ncbi:MAG: hypothetical protein LM575_04110 [Caldimicrobium sp.]|jgi:hypothetical protein|nr:hypothetical protein [Caldimicrobium sp.]
MEINKEHTPKNANPEENKLFCEKYKEWVDEGEGCRHKSDYCQFRKQCLIYLKEKFKDF